MNAFTCSAAALAALFTPIAAAAQSADSPPASPSPSGPSPSGAPPSGAATAAPPFAFGGKYGPDRFTLGFGGGIAPQYDGADDYQFQPGGIIRGSVSGFEFAARGPNIFLDLLREKQGERLDLIAGPVIALRLERSQQISDPRVALLGKRKAALELGGYVGIGKRGVLHPFDRLSADVAVLTDVSGVHRGTVIRPSVSYSRPVSGKALVTFGLSAEHVSENYGRTYFDVAPLAAPGALPAYRIEGSGFKSVGANLLFARALGRNPFKGWSLFALTGYSRVLGQYARSPIVTIAGERGQGLGVAGVAYSF